MARYSLRERQDENTSPPPDHDHDTDTGSPVDDSVLAHTDDAMPEDSAHSSGPMSWLWQPTGASRAAHKALLESSEQVDFMKFCAVLRRRGDTSQESMLTRFYLFMLDNLPQGLTGSFSHVDGNDVMDYLLCHKGASTPSRHKVTKQAEAAFIKLEEWMSKGATWREALERSTEANRERPKRSGSRKKPDGVVAGLHSPAGILALLIISHPDDSKFKNWIVKRLQISWMLTQDPETLFVDDEGFWNGLDAKNVYTIFAKEPERESEVAFAADYKELFGSGFAHAQKDLKPHLHTWAQESLAAERQSQVPEEGSSGSSEDIESPSKTRSQPAANHFPSQDIAGLRRHLSVKQWANPDSERYEMAKWLSGCLSSGDFPILSAWCKHWERALSDATSLQGQLIVHSLFMQSVRRLHSLWSASLPSVESMSGQRLRDLFMAVDINDSSRGPLLDVGDFDQTLDFLQHHPDYKPLDEATTRLNNLAEGYSQTVSDTIDWLSKIRIAVLSRATRDSMFFPMLSGMMALDALRSVILVQDSRGLEEMTGEIRFYHDKRDLLLSQAVVDALKLTTWQVRALLLPGDGSRHVLTDQQDLIFRTKYIPGKVTKADDFDALPPAPITMDFPDTDTIACRAMMFKLFGKVRPPGTTTAPVVHTPAVHATPVSPATTTSFPSTTPLAQASPMSAADPEISVRPSPIPNTPRNPFAGQSASAKRPASNSSDLRSSKVPRIGIKGGLEDLKDHFDETLMRQKAELRTEVRLCIEKLRGEVLEDIRPQLIATQDVSTALEHLKDDVKCCKDQLRDVEAALATFDSKIQGLSAEIKSGAEGLRAVEQRLSAMESIKAPRPEDEGYLRELCPAPEGENQRAYESRLYQACLYYIHLLWDPTREEGVSQDGESMEDTARVFPDLKMEDIAAALSQFHKQVFNRSIDSQNM